METTLELKKEIKLSELPVNIQERCAKICKAENREIEKINFSLDKVDNSIYNMYEGNVFTGWNYFVDNNEID